MNIKKYKVSISGESYTLVSDESEKHVMTVAQLVDSCIKEVASKGVESDPKRVSMLVAIQLASELMKAKEQLENYSRNTDSLINYIDSQYTQI